MASHGGILGLMLFTYFYARSKKVSWTGLGDGLCVVAPLGIMFGRIANFINGELYGRADAAFVWAMKFPNALWDPKVVESQSRGMAQQAAARADVDGAYAQFYNALMEEEEKLAREEEARQLHLAVQEQQQRVDEHEKEKGQLFDRLSSALQKHESFVAEQERQRAMEEQLRQDEHERRLDREAKERVSTHA